MGSSTVDARVDLPALLEHLTLAARDAGEFIAERAHHRARIQWQEKSGTDFVSEVDLGSEARLRERLLGLARTPGVPVGTPVSMVAEEGSPHEAIGHGLVYVADPLDGTTNFLHGFPWYAVSVAALLDGELIAGVVLNAATGELFRAARGLGATRDGDPIRVSAIDNPQRALLATGFPFGRPEEIAPFLAALPPMMAGTSGIRRAGSAALDLCDVACGRFEAFWELRLAPWDVAAGLLMCREAGAVCTDMHGRPATVRHTSILVGNAPIHAWVRERLQPALAAAS